MSIYIDTHTHLDFPDFDTDRTAVLADCAQLGVRRILLMGVSRSNWERIWSLVSEHDGVYAAFGLHPVFLDQHQPQDLLLLRERLAQHAGDPRCCAVGEFGLDYFVEDANREQQQHLFEAQLEIATDLQLPALLHVRRAHAPVIAALKRYQPRRGGIVHAFSGSLQEAQEYIRLGFKLGLGGAATWPQAKRMHRVIPQLPIESLVLETDSPDMAPAFRPYQRNSPQNLPQICAELARLRGETPDQLAQQCLYNTCELFDWAEATVS
ncbi:MAG: TatD family hydrolase [Pseudomonas sp.]